MCEMFSTCVYLENETGMMPCFKISTLFPLIQAVDRVVGYAFQSIFWFVYQDGCYVWQVLYQSFLYKKLGEILWPMVSTIIPGNRNNALLCSQLTIKITE